MITQWWQRSGFSRSAGTTTYQNFAGVMANDNTASHKAIPIYYNATLSNLFVRIVSNAASASSTVVSFPNGGTGNLTVTIGAGATGTFTDTTHTDTLTSGQTLCYQVNTGTGGAVVYGCTAILFDTGITGPCVSCCACGSPNSLDFGAASTTAYMSLAGIHSSNTTESVAQASMPAAVTAKYFSIYISANARSTSTTYGTRVGAAPGNLTVTVGASATGLIEDTSHSDVLSAGSLYNFEKTTGTGTGTISASNHCGIFFESATGSTVWTWSGQNGATLAAGSTQYFHAFSTENGYASTEAEVQIPASQKLRGRMLTLQISANATSATSTVGSRVNTAAGRQSLSIGSAATGLFQDTTNIDPLQVDDLTAFVFTVGTGGTITPRTGMFVFDLVPPHLAMVGAGR